MQKKLHGKLKQLRSENPTIPAIAWLWNSCNQRKSFFTEDCTCVMCDQQVLETRDHLFVHLPKLVSPVCRYSKSAQANSLPAQSSICNGCHHTDCLGRLEHEECICFQKGYPSPVSLPADVGSGRSFSGYFYLRAKRKSYPTLPDCQIPLVACAGKYSTIDNVLLFRTKQRNQFHA